MFDVQHEWIWRREMFINEFACMHVLSQHWEIAIETMQEEVSVCMGVSEQNEKGGIMQAGVMKIKPKIN